MKYGELEFYSTPIKTTQVCENVLEYFNLSEKIAISRSFRKEEFEYDDKSHSIILGSNYSELYAVGDELEIYYLFT